MRCAWFSSPGHIVVQRLDDIRCSATTEKLNCYNSNRILTVFCMQHAIKCRAATPTLSLNFFFGSVLQIDSLTVDRQQVKTTGDR